MKKVTLRRGIEEYNLCINNFKLVLGSNYAKKYEMMGIIRKVFNGFDSEYSESRNKSCQLLINDHLINSKKSLLLDLSSNYDLSSDLKLGSKSLALKYVEAVVNDNVLLDSINTLNLLFQSLEDELNKLQDDFHLSIDDFNIKTLLKLISSSISIDGEQANMYDLSYEDFVILLLKMADIITKSNHTYEEILIILDVPIITNKIMNFVKNIRGCIVIIIVPEYQGNINIENIFMYSLNPIDFADEELMYSILCEKFHVAFELKEIKQMLNNYIQGIEDSYTELIKNILE